MTSTRLRRVLLVLLAVLALAATACGGDDTGADDTGADDTPAPEDTAADTPPGGDDVDDATTAAPGDGPTITIGSFNFPESVILAQIYAQGLRSQGYPVETELDLGARELIFPELESGALGFLPEYVGSSLSVGFGGEPTADTDESLEMLQRELDEIGVTALEPAPGEDKNVYVVRADYAEEHDLTTISDLATVDGTVVLGGAPECETRDTCLVGFTDTYGLDNIEFEAIQESPVRVSSLENGQIDVGALFSTQPVIAEKGFVPLEDDRGIIPAENIVPVVNNDIIAAYGEPFISFVNSITDQITTELLLDLNGRAAAGEDPADIAAEWLAEAGVVEG